QERNDHPALAPYSHKRNGKPRCPGRGNVLTPERVALDGWIVNKPVKTAIDRRGQQPKAVTVLACEQGRDVRPRLCWCAPRAHHEKYLFSRRKAPDLFTAPPLGALPQIPPSRYPATVQ